MQIYVHRNDQQLGPFTEDEIKAQLAAGTLTPQDHVWWQGQAEWLPLSQTRLMPGGATPPAVTPGLTPMPGVTAPASTGKTSGLAIASLVCGVVGLLCGLLSIAAIICGHMSRSQIKKDPTLRGSGLALSGLILGYVWLPVYIFIIATSVLIALGNQVKGTFQTIQAQEAAAQATNSADQSATTPDQSTNSTDQTTPAPAATNAPDQSTNSAPAPAPATTPDMNTNSATPSTNSPAANTNSSNGPTNAAPMTQ